MCRQFEQQTTAICSQHVNQMLGQFATDKSQWKMKDCSIHLILGIAIRAESSQFGVSQVNDGVNVMDFFSGHVLTELQEPDMDCRPMVKATCIKFVSIFRNQFTKEQFGALMPLLIAHLGSPHVVVHTYAAAAIEKMLTSKVDGPNNTKLPKFGGSDLKPFLGNLFTGLFSIVENVENENEYVMKCIMRALSSAKEFLLEVVQIVLEKLTEALGRVAKNPKNPQYNHYLFESIAVLIGSVASKDAAHTSAFEQFLFPPFQHILQMEVVEFTPYVFQLLAQILEYRPEGSGLGQAYGSLLPPLLTPTLWERKGNIPALARLLVAYFSKGSTEIVQQNLLIGILGVFQKLISSKSSEAYAFDVLRAIILYVPSEAFMPRMKDILQILMMRLQQGKTPKYVGLVTHFFALFIGKFGSQTYLEQLDQIQPGLGYMILTQVWIPRLQSAPPTRLEAKTQVISLTQLLCKTPSMLADGSKTPIWSQILGCAVKIIVSPDSHLNALSIEGADDDVEIGYDATFSVLHFALRPAKDPFPEIADASASLVQSLAQLCASQPGQLTPLIQQGLQSDPKMAAGLESLCQKVGVSLV
jgi:exportin-2 (importin alpha re-exporter)